MSEKEGCSLHQIKRKEQLQDEKNEPTNCSSLASWVLSRSQVHTSQSNLEIDKTVMGYSI